MSKYDLMCKFIVIGSTQVGKTQLLNRFSEDIFYETTMTTIGVDFKFKEIQVNGKIMKMQIWDTAGQERYRTLTQNYYKGAHGVLLCFSVDDLNSFKEVSQWISSLKQHQSQIPTILVGTKADLEKRLVSKQMAQELAEQLNLEYWETSAKTGMNIQQVFERIASLVEISQKPQAPVREYNHDQTLKLKAEKITKTKKNQCC
ncbi:hypothetical protein pb186bvf_011574 [Paramecium bursaria]